MFLASLLASVLRLGHNDVWSALGRPGRGPIMAICTGCGGEAHALKVASWQDSTGSRVGSSWTDAPDMACFGVLCGDCLEVLGHRETFGAVHSITAAAVSMQAAELVSAWVGEMS